MADFVEAALNPALDAIGALADYVSLHSAYPGTTGTSELAGGAYTREAVSWDAADNGLLVASVDPQFDVPAASTVAWLGLWTALSAGTYLGPLPLGPVGDPKLATVLAGTDFFTAIGHGYANGDTITPQKTLGALPTGITAGATLFVRDVTTDTFKVATTSGGTAIDITVSGNALVRRITTESFGAAGTYNVTDISLSLS